MKSTVALFLLLVAAVVPAKAETPLPAGVHLISGAFIPGTQPDGNSVVFDARGGLIVVDTGRHISHTQKIIDYANERRQPVRAIINTHWHLDHVGGNVLLKKTFPAVRVYASDALEDALTGFLSDYHKQLEEMIATSSGGDSETYRAELALIDAGAKLGPDVIVKKSEDVVVAGRKMRLSVDRNAVTAADVWVFDRRTGVVVAGDLVTLPAPFLDTACPTGWSHELARVAKVPFRVLIPGHGDPMTPAAFALYRTAFDGLLRCAKSDVEKTSCIDGWVNGTRTLMPDAPEPFTRSLMNYYVDVLRGDPARMARLCGAS